jgi:hypothetical protein
VSDPTRTAPAGWYADPNGAPTLRWWDGTTWSEHYAPGAAITQERPRLTTDTKVDGVWIWLVAALPLVSIASYFLIDFRGYMQGLMTGDIRGALTVFGVGYFASLALSWITWGPPCCSPTSTGATFARPASSARSIGRGRSWAGSST